MRIQRILRPIKYFSVADGLVLALVATLIYGVVGFGQQWSSEFHPATEIDLSIWALPRYALFSAIRGMSAYLISLAFSLIVGYAAAKSKYAEWFLIPMLDIMQSIPVLGFLPGLVLTLIALFPKTNFGLELAAILMIFTGQVWNMTFSFYGSLKSLPTDFKEASSVIGLNWRQRLMQIEMPFAALGLAWNSLLSMAGGWFFLSVCEAFTLGAREYRLPGIGSYMAVAVARGDRGAMIAGVVGMATLIILMDIVIWRPVLAWVHRYRIEDVPGADSTEPWIQLWIRESWILQIFHSLVRRLKPGFHRLRKILRQRQSVIRKSPILQQVRDSIWRDQILSWIGLLAAVAVIGVSLYGVYRLTVGLLQQPAFTWILLVRNSMWTLLRVFIAVMLSTVWALPMGIWIALSPQRLRIAQPVIQVLASFPAPMLYPLAIAVFFGMNIPFDIGSMFLMMLGVQWYILFNVMAGAMRISSELRLTMRLMNNSRWDQWWKLYLPSVFPYLVNGWLTAAGGAWNASIVAEIVSYQGTVLETEGLGATISRAAASQNFGLLSASLFMMVVIVILLNRTVWAKLGEIAQNRFRIEVM